MERIFITEGIITAIDLLALTASIGIISFLVFVVPLRSFPDRPSQDAVRRLWHMLGIFLALLTLSSIGWLVQRSLILSGRSIEELAGIVPIVVLQTHFGRIWLLRMGALLLLWWGWRATRSRFRPCMLGMMLIAGAAVAATRSLSSHAADAGDFTVAELADWTHLLGVSVWGGSLIALSLTGFQVITYRADERRHRVVDMVVRWSSVAGIALAVVVATGIYNAFLQVGSIDALWTTRYGQMLLTKLLLVTVVVVLGAANRYIGVPALRAWANGLAEAQPLLTFTRRAALEAGLLIGVIICVAVLVNLVPARHGSHMQQEHGSHGHDMMHAHPGAK